MKELISQSKEMSREYCCTVVQIGEVKPIEGADFLGQTLVNGLSIVVRKDLVKEGSYMFYAANETQLNLDFLSVNNQYEFGERHLNANADEVERLYNLSEQLKREDKFEESSDFYNQAKSMVGFFGKNGRVKMIRLKGCPSMGYLFGIESMINWCPMMKDFDMAANVGVDFDTVNGEKFICAYVPPIKEYPKRLGKEGQRNKVLKKFDRMIQGQFAFHYDTQQLNREIYRIKPEDIVTCSIKLHGTSICIGNVKVKAPKIGGLYAKLFNYLPKWLQFTKEVYDVIYSSRTVIKNSKINSGVTSGFYGTDVWGTYYDLLKGKIPQGYTLYGEIIGYVTGSNTMIQKGFDYKCKPGENKLMIYRISEKVYDEEGHSTNKEWNVRDVYNWTVELVEKYPELKNNIHPIDIVYEGTLANLYPNLSLTDHWHENVLEAMKVDKEHFGMEENESLCRNRTPREGIVLRINDDPVNEAFKLKCIAFLSKEAKMIDAGEVDIELSQGRYDSEDSEENNE